MCIHSKRILGNPKNFNLLKYLRQAWIFLPNSSGKNDREIIFSRALLFNQILVLFYLISWIFSKDESAIVLNSDFNSIMGKHRRAFDLVWFLWAFASSLSGYRIHRKPPSGNHPWWKLSLLLSGEEFYESNNFRLLVKIFRYVTVLQSFCAPTLVTIQFIFFIMYVKNFQYWLLKVTILLQAIIAVYMGVSYSVNTGSLFCIHIYGYGVTFGDRSKTISNLRRDKILEAPLEIRKSILLGQKLYEELVKIEEFYAILNSNTFAATFVAQIFILYQILFTEIAILTKIEFVLYGIMNWLCGQSLIFFSSWFARNKVE